MPIILVDEGSGNTIINPMGDVAGLNGTIVFRGNGNTVRIGEGTSSYGFYIELGHGCDIDVGDNCFLSDLYVFGQMRAKVAISRNASFSARVRLLLHEASSIEIGEGCLFANDIDCATSDMHSIVSISDGSRINPAEDIRVASHVWVGQRVLLLKGSRIGTGSVIGAGSIVSRDIPEHVVATGVPASIVRTGISWRRELI